MNRTKISTIAVATTALVALGCGSYQGVDERGKKVNAGAGASAGTTPAALPPSKAPTLTPKDITLKVKILSKHCFGSAGCNLEFRITEVSVDPAKIDKSTTYEITYTYKGLEDPVENTFTLYGDGRYEVQETEFGSAKRKSDTVTAVVTGVEKV